ncbi:MAG: hypothetical protein MK102_08435 [Fuerstiella sp.]|nr:hypothetical protein [Fuerstiella sp.]
MSCLKVMLTCAIAFSLVCPTTVEAQKRRKTEVVKGKRYKLHKAHGPYMILVTTLRNVDPGLRAKGMSAEDAADQIVYELRRKGIPAYVYHQKEQLSEEGRFIQRQEGLAIMAGNFPTAEHRVAQAVLKIIQEKFRPQFLKQPETGAIIVDQLASMPFKRAFIVANPLRNSAELEKDEVDPELVQMNANNGKISLLKNPGRYTLKVATFRGNQIVQVAAKKSSKKGFGIFGQADESATSAWELATALRRATKYGYDKNYEAWVLHDTRKSYVTIGSFNSPDDPRIRQLIQEFKAKVKPNPRTGEAKMTPELFSIPKNPVKKPLPDKLWFFDESPRAVAVPGRSANGKSSGLGVTQR